MRTVLKTLVGVLVAGLIAIVVVLVFVIDPNDYKDEITARAEAALGRQLVIDGDIDLRLGLNTALAVDGVRVANPPWASEPDLLSVDSFAAEVAVLPLLRGGLVIKALRLQGARVLLERNEAGEANWEFAAAGTGGDGDAGPAPTEESGSSRPLNVPVLQELTVEDVRLTFRDAAAAQDIDVALDSVRLTGDGPDRPLNLTIGGSYNALPFRAQGELGAPSTLAGNSPYPVNIRAEALGFSVGVDGSIAEPATASGLNLRVTVDGTNLSGLAAIAGDGLPSGGPLSLATAIRGDPAQIELADLHLVFGQTEVSGELLASIAGTRPRLTGSLQSPRLDLAALMPPDTAAAPPSSGTADGAAPSDGAGGKRVLPEDPLPLDALRGADIDLAIDVAELFTPDLAVRNVTLRINLDAGVLRVDPFGATAANSALTGRIALDASTEDAVLDFDLQGPALDLGALVQEISGQDIVRGSAAIDVSLQGTGTSVAAIAGSLNGHSRMVMDEGMARTESFDLIVSGLTGVASALFSGQEEFTVIDCLATDLSFDNGVATTLALAETELVVVTGEGTINLADESLDLKVTPRAKSPTLSLAVPIDIGGTLADPSFTPDAVATAARVGGLAAGLLGTVVFPPAALAALGDMGTAGTDCVQEAVDNAAAAAAAPQEAPALPSVEDVQDAVENLGRSLRGLFDR